MNANALINDIINTAADVTGIDPNTVDPVFISAVIGLTAGRCADIADAGDSYMTYNLGGDICAAFGLTA